ncbi:MAG: RNA polymerase sigma factor [Bacteriovoracia bacterium]
MDKPTDEDLMRRLQQDDMLAFEELFARHRERVWRFLVKRAPTKAEDLFQECFARVLERREQWNGSPFLPWLLVLARNLFVDDYRRERVRRTDALTQADVSTEVTTDVDEWLEGVPERERDLLKEHYLGGRSYQELSQRYGTSEASLRQRLSRTLRTLRKEMA